MRANETRFVLVKKFEVDFYAQVNEKVTARLPSRPGKFYG